LIVEEAEPIAVDRDLLWVLTDWRLTSEGRIAAGFGNMMEAGMSGRVGNTVTLNGFVPGDQVVRSGERIRLRLVNTSLARIMALRFEGHDPVVVALDGQPCDPHLPKGNRLLLGPAMRIDLLIDMGGAPGSRHRVVDDFYAGLEYELTRLAYSDEPAAGEICGADRPAAKSFAGTGHVGFRTPRTDAGGRHDEPHDGWQGHGWRHDGRYDGHGTGRLVDQRDIHDRRRPRGHDSAIRLGAWKKPSRHHT
jgi:hypothetical protein